MDKESEPRPDAMAHVEHTTDTLPDVDTLVHGKEKWINWRVLMNLIIVGLALGLFGYDNAFVSPLVSLPLFVNKYQGPGFGGALVFTAHKLELIIPVPLVGAALGAFAAIPLQKRLGRKRSFLLAYASCCIPGSILQLFAPNLGALVVGRFWNYFGISILTNIGPIYISELVPVRDRARAVGFTVAGSGAVSVIATVVVWGTEKINDTRQYKIPLAIQAAVPVLLLILSLALTESPTWLLSKGRVEEAKANLASLRGGNMRLVEAEISSALISLHSHEATAKEMNPYEIFTRSNLERTISAGALLCLSQVGGQILVSTYSTVILVQSGVGDPFKITILIFLLQFLGTLIGPFCLDKVGRRPVALFGFAFLFVIDIAAGALACAGLKTTPDGLALASLCIIFSFINSVSFQSLAYLLPTEIPTARLREPTMAWSTFWSYTTAIITTFAVPQITSADAGNLGAKAFLVFGGCMFITIIWTYFYLPETTNRTLAEIDELYASGVAKRNWKGYKTTATADATAQIMGSKFMESA
ncbi:MFS transporter [Xylogone sp. PMI_703]|nr:MFS transporter [Xylogone sp. PMI_703]